ncbi:MAG: ACP S-malonyltransferase [Candidatus Symbiobacter sp.]|nr:ACP S-malonyltransferase [Candidatus Symbiobacter sp.]
MLTPMKKTFLFPGQGSQAVGMGRDLADNFRVARDVFAEIDDALGQKLSQIMWEGPNDTLTLTENAQPALMAVSMAVMRVIESESGQKLPAWAGYVAGHSLGEYSALAAANAVALADCAKLLKQRGRAMQQAVAAGVGAMAALFPTTIDLAEKIARDAAAKFPENNVCSLANDNGNGQFVLSGHAQAIDQAVMLAEQSGIKRAVKLTVSAPFHCALMSPAAEVMADALAVTCMNAPDVPLIANVTALPVQDAATIKKLLVEQVTGRVRWREAMEYLAAQGVEEMVEIGAGKVLAGLIKKLGPNITARSVGTPADIADLLKTLS